jgi:hypothetical protein
MPYHKDAVNTKATERFDDSLRLATYRAIFSRPGFEKYAIQAVSPIRILGATLSDPYPGEAPGLRQPMATNSKCKPKGLEGGNRPKSLWSSGFSWFNLQIFEIGLLYGPVAAALG